jgi:hypothetical protein
VFLHLNVPPLMRIAPSVVMYPKDVVEWIRDANNGEKDQGPLKDAAGALPAEVVAKVHSRAPTEAADAGATGSTVAGTEDKAAAPTTKKRLANKREETKVESSAIH